MKEFRERLNLARELLITLPWSHNQLDDDGGDMGRCDTPKESIANLLHAKALPWDHLLIKFAESLRFSHYGVANQKRLQFLLCAACQSVWKPFPSKFGVTV